MKRKLLCISFRFPPETYPLASRITYMLEKLEHDWDIEAITAAEDAAVGESVKIHHIPARTPQGLIQWLRKVRMAKLVNLFMWPDQYVFWVLPAYRKALKLIKERKPDLILVFMMPYSTGLVGLMLQRKTGLPVVFNLNDSPTCTDMNPSFPSRIHFNLAHWLENLFARKSEAIIYVSGRNLKRVRMRQKEEDREKFHLIRRGAKILNRNGTRPSPNTFKIVYTGGMSGWYQFLERDKKKSLVKKLIRTWDQFGRYELVKLDHRSHSPVYIGKAIKKVVEKHPEWKGLINVSVYGNRYPKHVVDQVLGKFELEDIIEVNPPVAHEKVRKYTLEADLLFMALPERKDKTPGGRISAKTYEYLMSDRPVLAAIPEGENREFLVDKDGIHIVDPKGVDAMAEVIEGLMVRKMAGEDLSVDRSDIQAGLTNIARASDFSKVLDEVLIS